MTVERILALFDSYAERPALVWQGDSYTYSWLSRETRQWIETLGERPDIDAGAVVGLSADYSPRSLALLLALFERKCIVAPLTKGFDRQKETFHEIAEVSTEIVVDDAERVEFRAVGHPSQHELLSQLRALGTGGLILFSSGSSGKNKAVVHDAQRLLNKFSTPRRATITIPFMLFDHIGGVNTVLHILSSGGTAVIAPERDPATICGLVAAHKVEVLPTTPTFINLMLLSGHGAHDLSSLKVMAYGAERMPAASLQRLQSILPNVQLIQNYGLSEVGIMRSQSESSGSLWVKLGGDGFETRVRDGHLEIKAQTAMLGYLNAPSPFTDDGWLMTGDLVETKGEYVRILGRSSDIIIIGGEKVYPAEIEDAIANMADVIEVVVSAESNAITGQIVKAQIRLSSDEKRSAFRKRMADYLSDKLAPYKIPQRIVLSKVPLHNSRFKKSRGHEV